MNDEITCVKCLGAKHIFNGEDYENCNLCNTKGVINRFQSSKFDPMDIELKLEKYEFINTE